MLKPNMQDNIQESKSSKLVQRWTGTLCALNLTQENKNENENFLYVFLCIHICKNFAFLWVSRT